MTRVMLRISNLKKCFKMIQLAMDKIFRTEYLKEIIANCRSSLKALLSIS